MGFLDKVKEQAAVATTAAKDAAQKGQSKIEDAQAKRGADALLRDLGAAYYAAQTGRAIAQTETDVQNFIAQLQQYEATHGPVNLNPTTVQAPFVAPQADGSAPPVANQAPPSAQPVQDAAPYQAPPAAHPMAPPTAQPMAPPTGSTL
jgi:hypothetical protein